MQRTRQMTLLHERVDIYYLFVLCNTYAVIVLFFVSLRSVFQFSIISQSLETLNSCFGSHGCGGSELISTTSHLLSGSFASPDACGLSLHTGFTAEWRHVFGVLADLELLDDLSQSSTVSGSILSADSNLLCSLCHYVILYLIINN